QYMPSVNRTLAVRSPADAPRMPRGPISRRRKPCGRSSLSTAAPSPHRSCCATSPQLRPPPRSLRKSLLMLRAASCVAPCRLAGVDQFELDRGHAKNSDHDRLLRGFLDAVVVRRMGDPSDEAPGGHGNGDVRIETGAAVHPPRA